ncbi:NADH--flavin oxidoreductase/NADH oxidase [Candidatus Koribacter versatilis Ellin345]|uniref:NADH--flavin oxidoreductase/NADH oxidase n=1 Tax=Koribacter versatilis (strain Ellin345) TaxID=204669 RepID=Q1IP05_KORVE|nr:NADH:flavin oxidoreductase/NADH oxidase [Candidatus Koribacter versatilis]ABF41395.1 NADH--flavin oxidoreductase/NADH oxidase [Candidatus Koribacter versatilis Ellin345]
MHLFDPLHIRSLTLKHRVVVSPMCQYSSQDGFASDWHLVQLGRFAVGGASLVFTEANAVTPEGRISPSDLGIWKDDHIEPLARIVRFIKQQGAYAGTQLAHAGRKASTAEPWNGGRGLTEDQGGWQDVYAPSAIPFNDTYIQPVALDKPGIQRIVAAFGAAAQRALLAGFEVVEIHGAHGYLANEFLSPLSNQRTDEYGGSFENRTRFVREVTEAIRRVWPERLPLFMRVSATDYAPGGWTIEESVELARIVKPLGVDLIDTSSGGLIGGVQIPVGPGYQVNFADRIRREAGILTGAVGMITSPAQADQIVRNGNADVVLLARELLRHPNWPLSAARTLNQKIDWPRQHIRAAN